MWILVLWAHVHVTLIYILSMYFLTFLLLWLVDVQVAETALVEVRTECVPSSCFDENVCHIQQYKNYTSDA